VGPRYGVLLFNLGGPATLDDVEPFLVNLFSDRDIIELPLGRALQPAFARVVAKVRGPSVRRNYASIGGGSPQLRLTLAQARALSARLSRADGQVPVAVAMRYWRPGTAEALQELADAGVERVVTLTLYPHYSRATTGSSERELARVMARPEWQGRFRLSGVDRYPEEPAYLDALAATVRESLAAFPAETRDGVVLLFSAHGLPRRFVDAGDPYVAETQATVRGILERVGAPNRHALGYQSRTGPVKWIGPGTDEILRELGREGVRAVLVVPVSFVSDHIETLYELDQLFAGVARAAGIEDYRRSPALNTRPAFVEALAGLVERHLEAVP
jgi:ferrochelatase